MNIVDKVSLSLVISDHHIISISANLIRPPKSMSYQNINLVSFKDDLSSTDLISKLPGALNDLLGTSVV